MFGWQPPPPLAELAGPPAAPAGVAMTRAAQAEHPAPPGPVPGEAAAGGGGEAGAGPQRWMGQMATARRAWRMHLATAAAYGPALVAGFLLFLALPGLVAGLAVGLLALAALAGGGMWAAHRTRVREAELFEAEYWG